MQWYIVQLLVLVVLCVRAQRTFMRTCDCEYTVDGKCAYTLLLPLTQEALPNCDSHLPPNTAENVQSRLKDLSSNVSQLGGWLAEHSRILNQLQSALIAQQRAPVGPNNTVTFDNTTLDLIRHAHEQNTRIGALEMQVASMQVLNSQYSTNLETLRKNLTVLMNQVSVLSKSMNQSMEELARQDVSISWLSNIATVVEHRLGHLLCLQKGVLVSGPHSAIDTSHIQVSSQYDDTHGPARGRLNNTGVPGAWCPGESYVYVILKQNSLID